MNTLVLLSSFLFVGVGTVVGLRLLQRALASRGLTEASIGIALFAYAAIAHPASMVRGVIDAATQPGLAATLSIVSSLASAVTLVGLYVFTWRTFRPRERWAFGIFLAGVSVGLAASAAMIRIVLVNSSAPAMSRAIAHWIVVSVLSYAMAFAWAGLESLVYWVPLRRRVRFGLADPTVANRFLLWGTACCSAFAIDMALIALMVLGADFMHDVAPRLLVCASGLVNTTAWFLSFLPPAAYVRWIERRASVQA